MKENILEIIERLENIENDYGYRDLETAFYLYGRFGKDWVEDNLDDDDVDEIDKMLENYDGSLFNEDINNYVSSNFE